MQVTFDHRKMESEQHHYELRSRSRSRSHTPLVHNQPLMDMEQAEHHYDLRSKSRERSHTPGEATSTRRSSSRSMPSSVSKVRGQNMQTITENTGKPVSEITTESQSKQSDSSVSVVTKKVERRSERQRAKRQIFANGQDETKEEISDNTSEQVRKSVTPHRMLTSDYSSEEGEREDPPSRPGSAYEIYKQAGEWWNKFPKTDYTYSQKSQCRYEIAPGILAMPNMSRRSIHSNGSNISSTSANQDSLEQSVATTESGLGDTLDSLGLKNTSSQNLIAMDNSSALQSSTSYLSPRTMMFKKTHVEQYTMHREVVYAESKNSLNARQRDTTDSNKYDSDMELDEAVSTTLVKNTQRWKIMQQLQRFNTVIVAWFLKSLEFLKLRTSRKREYRTYHERTYYNESYWSKSWRLIVRYLQSIYLVLAKLLFFDCWVLSQFSGIRKRLLGPRIIWAPIILLFLLAGAYFMLMHSFICLDYLQNIQYGVTETVYHVFNEISKITFLIYEFFSGYVTQIKYYFLQFVPSLNVSLPKTSNTVWNLAEFLSLINLGMQAINHQLGYWGMSYVLPFFSALKMQIASNNETNELLGNVQRFMQEKTQHEEYSTSEHNLNVIIDRLNDRISELEKEDSYQTEYLSNISRVVQNPKENHNEVWQRFNVKIMEIEQRLDNLKTGTTNDIGAIKTEFQTLRELNAQLKSCCNRDKELLLPGTLRLEIDKIMGEYFGNTVSKNDLSVVIDKLKKLSVNTEDNIVPISSDYIMKEGSMLDERINKIVDDRLKIYDADKTGRVDYAVETAGGEIINTRCTQTYDKTSGTFKLLGITIYSKSNNPRSVIQGNPIQPGACWPFQGFPGYLLIKLRSSVYVTGFTIEHAPKSILPSGEMKSAPRKFNVWGLTDKQDPEPVLLGDYEFKDSDNNLQYFPVQNTNIVTPYEYVELRIHSNHGELEYTCLYRFRVHGKPA
ncbi:hypothetical protein KPH14_001724 [Odynerus spinipes]|uniref:SUN domain-containing protein n=1 Tax=Odynerus spinipes TaxID=1348599 RepID=A0AAD9VWU3_9HYME|nr:hypothetical protein KPH14_001724 [Odynerus spinipes]